MDKRIAVFARKEDILKKTVKYVLLILALLFCLTACGGEAPSEAGNDAAQMINLLDGYKVVYDVNNTAAVKTMMGMVDKLAAASGTKMPIANVNTPESELEIQFGLASGRKESESVHNAIEVFADEDFGVFAIRCVGKKIVVTATDEKALEVAADRFGKLLMSDGFKIESDYSEMAAFVTSEYSYGSVSLLYADENGIIKKPSASLNEPEERDERLSTIGIDNFIGLHTVETITTVAVEDTYFSGGDYQNTNFGEEKTILVKAAAGGYGKFYRDALIKFDISAIEGVEIGSALLELTCTSMENTADATPINIYGCNPYDWEESEVTYNTAPEKEELICSVTVSSTGKISVDILEYVKLCRKFGDKEISLYIEGDSSMARLLKFTSVEGGDNAPKIVFGVGEHSFTTLVEHDGENPWDVAMECYSDWEHRWAEILARGDSEQKMAEYDEEEFTIITQAASVSDTDGNATKYKDYKTRTVATLKGYEADTSELLMLDEYGGLMDESMKQEATGFFYTKKIGDRWWAIDPLGYPFFRTAVNTIKMRDKLQMPIYGSTANWAEATTNRLRELGFNTAGCWSDAENLLKAEQPLAQTTRHMKVMSTYASQLGINVSTAGNTEIMHNLMPVFDPDFVASADASVKSTVSGYETNPYIYGWISDNELPHSYTMLDSYLRLDPGDSRFAYSYATAWTFMYMKTGKEDVSLSDLTNELRYEFRAMVYDRYFKVVKAALDRYAPYQMYLGCRFIPGCYQSEQVMRVAGYWCDAVTFNYYGAWTASASLLANQAKWAGKPVIVTEWYAKGMDVWEKDSRMTNKSGAGWTVKDQKARGQFYQNFALSLMEGGSCIGFDWFLYWDNDPTDTSADSSNRNSNKGIVDNNGNEYPEFSKYIEELNNQKYNLISFLDER